MPEMGALDTLVHEARARRRSSPINTTHARTPGPISQSISDDWPERLALGLVVSDAVTVGAGIAIASVVVANHGSTAAVATALWFCWMFMLSVTRSRRTSLIGVGLTQYQRVLTAMLLTYAGVAIAALHFDIPLAQSFLAAAIPGVAALVLVERFVWRQALQRLRRAGRCFSGGIVVGPEREVVRTVRELRRNLTAGYRPIAVAVTGHRSDTPPRELAGLPRIELADLVHVVRSTRSRAVLIAGDLPGGPDEIRSVGWALENLKTELILVPRLTDVAGPRMHLRRVEGLPMVHVELPQYSGVNHVVKRVFDLVAASVMVAALAPVLLGVALAIRLEGKGPILFRQVRVGARGRTFTMLKFRSMVVDAEKRLEQLRQANEGAGVLFKMKRDPRVTRVGAFLRRYSLDELPQLFNVLGGSMSLVGPRPPLREEVELYEDRVSRRLLTKPGITGLWQVRGRSNLSWEESVRLDLYYVENWSLTGDLLILGETVRAVLTKDGAY